MALRIIQNMEDVVTKDVNHTRVHTQTLYRLEFHVIEKERFCKRKLHGIGQ